METSCNYFCQFADRSGVYLSPEEGKKAMQAYSQGGAIFVRGRLVANHMISMIRPCRFEENEDAEDYFSAQTRKTLFQQGKLKIEESKQNGETKFCVIGSEENIRLAYPESDHRDPKQLASPN